MYTTEEILEHREKWLQALESGNYQQCRGVLQDETGFCCLGVACEISGLGKWENHPETLSKQYNVGEVKISVLPQKVKDYLGLVSENGDPREYHKNLNPLTMMNDKGDTFKQIAAHLRANYDKYFKPLE